MRKLIVGFGLVAVSLFAVGCVHGPVGTFYSNSTVPADATENPTGDKTGKACQQTILGGPGAGLLTFGDASIQTAAQDGNISKVSSVSSEWTTIFVLYAQNCTVVSGN
jgi:hypothetical protein